MPNSGDEIQLMKSGIIQLAHIYVINKCDLSDTTWMEQELRENVSPKDSQDWNPPVLKTSALKCEGIPELVQAIFAHEHFVSSHKSDSMEKVSDFRLDPAVKPRDDKDFKPRDDKDFKPRDDKFQVKGINHLGIVPKDKDQAKHFFSKILGLVQEGHEIVEDQKVSIDFIRCENVRLEFLAPTAKESPITKFLETKGSGIQHIAFEVDDIDACVAYLNQQKIELIDKIPKPGAHHTRIVFIHPRSTGGILVELVEEKKSGAV
jgi:methylmalonyl-CoA/ethylmalonyl-CoA epimerase